MVVVVVATLPGAQHCSRVMDSFPVWLYVFGRLLQRLDLLPAHIPQIFARSLLQIFHARCLPACPPAGNPHTHSPTLFAAALQVLLIIAATHLDAVAFQIFSQSFKLVPTALFAYWLRGQTLAPMQVRQRCGEAWSGMQGERSARLFLVLLRLGPQFGPEHPVAR